MAPTLAFARTPVWDQAEPAMQAACEEVVETLGERARELALPAAFERVHDLHPIIMEADIAKHFGADYDRGAEQISDGFKSFVEQGRKHSAVDYNRAIDAQGHCNDLLDEVFDAYDAILTPAAPGEAPVGLETTGNPAFGTIWTFTGVPAITLPICRGEAGLPMGIQLIGQKGDDARLLRTARWLIAQLAED